MSFTIRSSRARISAALLAAVALVVAPLAASPAFAANPVEVDLLTINDFHGRIEAAPPIAGAAQLAGMVQSYEAANPNTIFAAAGDLIGASTFTSFIQQDQPTIDALNLAGLDVSSFGNHEFDQGRADVDGRVLAEADWPYLAANVYDRATGAPAYDEYYVQETGGVSIGFVGAVTEELPSLVSPAGISTLEVKPIVPEINRVAAALSDGDPLNGEADVVILLVHEGATSTDIASATDPASAFGKIVNGASADIDAIVSGHTHLAYDHDIPIPGTDRTRPVISAGEYGQKYGHTTISVDPDTGELLSIESEILPLAGFTPDAEVAAIVADAVAQANVLGNVSLGSITADLTRGATSTGGENRGSESTLGNLIAQSQLESTADLGVDLAIMNPGGIRADLLYAATGTGDPLGNVTYREAATAQPFANTLVTLQLTGAQLKQVLEQQWQPAGASRPYLRLGLSSGFEYLYNPTAAAGSHITSMSLNDVPVTADQVITVVANSFLASGGDNFFAFADGTSKADSGRIDLQSLVDYIGANSPVAPDLSQRSVGVQLSAPASGAQYLTGEAVTLNLSSLLFSRGAPTTGTATVSLNGTVLDSEAVTFALSADPYDEQGTASLAFTIPSGVTGAQSLTVTGPGGTEVNIPISIVAPVDTSTYAWPDRFLVKRGTGTDVTVYVRAADRSAPVGVVTVLDRGIVIGTATLTAADAGRIEVPTGNLARGLHVLTVNFVGDGAYEDSHTRTVVVAY